RLIKALTEMGAEVLSLREIPQTLEEVYLKVVGEEL
ncbi:MAG: ABC transporter ATP-binding protein, partial [Chloroflexi bacterium]